MKKLALTIAVSSFSLIAANAYAEEKIYSGEIKIGMGKATTPDSEFSIGVATVNISFDPSYTVSEDLSVMGFFDLGAESGTTYLGDAYLGAEYMGVVTTVGTQSYASGGFGIGTDKDNGVSGALGSTGGVNDVIVVSYSADEFSGAVSMDSVEDDTYFDIFGDFYLTDATLAATVQLQGDETYLGLSGSYAVDEFSAGAEFTMALDAELTALEVAGTYTLSDAAKLGAGLGVNTAEELGLYLNIGYSVHSNLSTYAEVSMSGVEDDEVGFTAGVSLTF